LPTDVRGKERVDDRRVISGILHVLKSGCRWKDCPPEYGPYTTVYNRFARWAERGVWEHLFRELARRGRATATQMIDSTHIKAHRSASGGKGGSRPAYVEADKTRTEAWRQVRGDTQSVRYRFSGVAVNQNSLVPHRPPPVRAGPCRCGSESPPREALARLCRRRDKPLTSSYEQ
jgi:transposase